MKNNMKPYKETINNNIIRRSFSKDVNENELSWHRDKKDRVVIVLENNDWMIQFDNELPKKLNVNEEIFIPKNTFHRVIKGSGDLMVEVIETDFEDGEYAIFEIIQEGKKKKKKTKRDACYYKVKSRYSVWPSAYGSGALVKCRKVGAANWGNKTDENIDDQINEKWSEKYKKSIDCSNPKGFSQKAHCQGRKKIKESITDKKNISFEHEHLNTHHGQSDYELGVYEDGEVMGYVDYTIFNNEITVSDILVRPNRRREGFGSMLIKKMKQLHPEAEYKPSLKTDLGSKFIHKDVNIKESKEPEYALIEITKALAYMGDKYRYQLIPKSKLENRLIDIKKGASGYKAISPNNVKVIETGKKSELETKLKELQIKTESLNEGKKKKVKTNFSKEKSQGLHGWFSRKGGEGSQGWVDCNTCRKNKETGRLKCKPCGREEGEKRAKYPACRPYPSACKTKGKGKSWGKKSIKENMENFKQKLEEIMSNKDEMSNNYMFWQNLKTIYNAVSEMKGMDFENVDNVLSDGHGWALDHIATSKDDIEEVYHFLKNKIDMHGFDKHYIQRQLNETFGDDDDDERPKQTNDKDSKDKKSKKHNIEKPLNIKRENKPFLPMADIE